MTDTSIPLSAGEARIQPELFRPSLVYPSYSYGEMLAHTAERYPEHTAIAFKEVNLTYRELDALVNSFANALLDLGIGRGQVVCLFLKNRPEFIIAWWAIARIGAIGSPLSPFYKEREITYQLNNNEAVAIVTQPELQPLIEATRADLPALRHVIIVGSDRRTSATPTLAFSRLVQTYPPTYPTGVTIEADDVVALPYSSGTTGLPKGVMLTHKNLVYNVCQSVATARITFEDRMLVFISLFHMYGLMLLGLAALSGARIVLMERFETEECLRLIQEHGITLLYTVPRQLALLLDEPHLDDYDVHTVRFTQCGAAPVPLPLARRFTERTGIPVMVSYGLTEAAPGTHSNPVYDPRLMRVETVGLPIHDTRQKVVDIETGQRELGVGEEGELIVQGPQIMKGYWKAPEATAETLRNGWLYTGDIGFIDEQGYVTITDRKKEMIKYKALSISPAQIEAVLFEHPAVADVGVIAKPDEEAGEVPKAFVVRKAGYEDLRANDLLAWANGKLATYKNVREVEFIDAIPRSPTGKILRKVLKEQERNKMSGSANHRGGVE